MRERRERVRGRERTHECASSIVYIQYKRGASVVQHELPLGIYYVDSESPQNNRPINHNYDVIVVVMRGLELLEERERWIDRGGKAASLSPLPYPIHTQTHCPECS